MNANIKSKWVAALRSGQYKQGQYALRTDNKFCPLGLLCELHRLETGQENWKTFANVKGCCSSYFGNSLALPEKVILWAGLDSATPSIMMPGKKKSRSISLCNDGIKDKYKKLSFKEIAKLIEKSL